MKSYHFISCEICFPNIEATQAAMSDLAELGIEAEVFEGIHDPYSPATFVGAWECIDVGFEKAFEEDVIKIADRHGGWADSFGARDRIPTATDFGFAPVPHQRRTENGNA